MNGMDQLPAGAVVLLNKLCEAELAPNEAADLERLICENPAVCRLYLRYVDLHVELRRRYGCAVGHAVNDWPDGERGNTKLGMMNDEEGMINDESEPPESFTHTSSFIPHSSSFPLSPSPAPLSSPFIGGPVFSYMVATVILGMMLLGAWAYKISHDVPLVVDNSRRSTTSGESANQPPEPVFVGRITGMKDCRWSDPTTQTYLGSSVPLNRRYALSSGLMEISYDSGAKVILEGPCSYKVESGSGGFLALGELTVRVEKGKEGREKREERGGRRDSRGLAATAVSEKLAATAKPQAANLKFPKLQSSKFSVRTPTAVITDLGTEFGVEVGKEGDTVSFVFRGLVKVQTFPSLAGRGAGGEGSVVLRANESARVKKDHKTGGSRIITGVHVGAVPKFARYVYEPPKYLDLLDIVAGGDGTGNHRERGIDPTSGMEDPLFVTHYRQGDNRFRPVFWHRLIDGVFVPNGGAGSVQLDSVGHAFDGFPKTSGETYGSIWSRAADIGPKRVSTAQPWVYAILQDEQFMPRRRGLMGIYANGGITFDLRKMRRASPDMRPTRFRAIAGLGDGPRKDPEALGIADVWVFVDGQLKLKREKLRARDGTFPVDVALDSDDHFLTLAATDGGNGISWDSVVFGDPVLEMNEIHDYPPQSDNRKEADRK